MTSGLSFVAQAGASAALESGGAATIDAGAGLSLQGAIVQVNPGPSCRPAARISDPIAGTAAPGGAVTGAISGGTGRVCIG